MFYWVKTTALIKKFFGNYIWDIPNSDKTVYLTFDDGPTPDITYWILDQLREHGIKATFFCVGENLIRYPEVAQKLLKEGHIIANHTFTHPNGWTTSTDKYIEDTLLCEEEIRKALADFRLQKADGRLQTADNRRLNADGNFQTADNRLQNADVRLQVEDNRLQPADCNLPSAPDTSGLPSNLFRPPYGKLTPRQSKILRKRGYKIIMWDVLTADFLPEVSKEECLNNVTKNATSGSIIVFHDNPKAYRDLEYALPKAIKFLKEKGYKFDIIRL